MLFLCCSCTVISVGRELITESTGVVGVQSSHIFWFTEFIFQNVIRFITLINWYFLLALVRILVWRSARLLIKVGGGWRHRLYSPGWWYQQQHHGVDKLIRISKQWNKLSTPAYYRNQIIIKILALFRIWLKTYKHWKINNRETR